MTNNDKTKISDKNEDEYLLASTRLLKATFRDYFNCRIALSWTISPGNSVIRGTIAA